MKPQLIFKTRFIGVKKMLIAVSGFMLCNLPHSVWASIYSKTPGALPNNPIPTNSLLYTFLGLLLVITVIIGGAWLLRRVIGLQMTVDGSLKIVAGLSLGTRERVVLLQVGDEQILLGVAPGRIQALHKLETPVAPHLRAHADKRNAEGFAERLLAAIKHGKSA